MVQTVEQLVFLYNVPNLEQQEEFDFEKLNNEQRELVD